MGRCALVVLAIALVSGCAAAPMNPGGAIPIAPVSPGAAIPTVPVNPGAATPPGVSGRSTAAGSMPKTSRSTTIAGSRTAAASEVSTPPAEQPTDDGVPQQTYTTHEPGADEEAIAALQGWDAYIKGAPSGALVVFGELDEVNGFFGPNPGDEKLAYLCGKIRWSGGDAPAPKPVAALVNLPGQTRAVPVLDPDRTLVLLQPPGPPSPDCPTVPDLVVEQPRLTTLAVLTPVGSVSLPAWRFAIRGTKDSFARVALGPDRLYRPSSAPSLGGGSPFSVSPDGRTLTVQVAGGALDASQPCGADYAGRAVENPRAVAVIIVVRAGPDPAGGSCPSAATTRIVRIRLAAPLGGRAVLDARSAIVLSRQ